MIKDYFTFAFNNLKYRGLRSWLTMLGIFIGIAAVVSLISLGQGLQKAINEQFKILGTDKITISAGSGFSGPPGSTLTSARLTKEDVNIIKKINGVDEVAEMLFKQARVKYKDELKYNFVHGIPLDESRVVIEEMNNIEIAEGKRLKEGGKYEVVVGENVAKGTFFKKPVGLKDTINIEGKDFKVVGILRPIGNPVDDASLYIPLETLRELFNEPEGIAYLFVRVKEGEDINKVAELIKEKLRKSHDVKKGEEDFQVATSEQLAQTFSNIFTIVQTVLIGIAAISLLVGGIGIMNTMYTSVLERTKDIGIMKAIGAKNSDILLIFLIESGLLGLAGGSIGITLGIGLSKGTEIIAGNYLGSGLLRASFSPYLIVGALIFSFIVGTVSGIMPARQASKMKPVDALRYE
ncbi:MAG: ABC transporter permease [Nanoarchaeota archaeon]